MPDPDPVDPAEKRLQTLEREVQSLKMRIIALERLLGTPGAEHPSDRGTVERKVVYDWQA